MNILDSILDAVLLDARQDVASALRKIERSNVDLVAIRRAKGLIVYWYTFPAREVTLRIVAGMTSPNLSIEDALDLHEHQASPVHDISHPPLVFDSTATVIINNGEFVGICPADARLDASELLENIEPSDLDMSKRRYDLSIPSGMKYLADAAVVGEASRTSRVRQDRPSSHLGALHESTSAVHAPPSIIPHQEASTNGWTGETLPRAEPILTKPPFTAYPRLDSPDKVSSLEVFAATIGLTSKQQEDTIGGPITISLPDSEKTFTLDLMVVADGFEMPKGSRFQLEVDRDNPEVRFVSVPLIAPSVVDDALLTTISVIYFFEKVPCGTAARKIVVLPKGKTIPSTPSNYGVPWLQENSPSGTVNIQSGTKPIDLTVIISKPDGNPASGQFLWSFHSPHSISFPALPVIRDLGTDAKDLGSRIIEGVQNSEVLGMVELEISGLGKTIADRMPTEFWRLLEEVGEAVHAITSGNSPTVLFLTAESSVPWELAYTEKKIDPDAPPYLGCQVNMARWPLSDSGNPPLPPSASIDVHQIAVVVGDYAAMSGWRALKKAKEEGDSIAAQFDGIKLGATSSEIRQLLYAELPKNNSVTGAEAIHFACHGEALSGHALDAAIILDNGARMSPTWLAAAPIGKQYGPFLFLNACQVGKAGELLGSFSGFAGESLRGGFRGFLAPLWSVDDSLASEIAREFYDRTFGTKENPPQTVASVLRDLRRRFAPRNGSDSATSLAYVFYGHPNLTLHRG